jgi:fucose permease
VDLRRLLREPYLRNLALIQGLYCGVEIGIAGWLATYLVEQFGAAPAAGALATSFYWAGFLVGRPTTAYVAHRYGPQRVLPWICLAGVVAAAAGVASGSAVWAVAAYTAAGLAISGIFPTVMALGLEGRTHDAGAATALIVGAAALGGIVWPWLVGVVAQEVGLRPAMATAAAPLLVMLPLIQATRHVLPAARSILVPPAAT